MTYKTIGERVAYLRKKAGLTQTGLMKLLKFDNLGKYETNERLPRTDLVIDLANFFHVTTDWLLTGTVLPSEGGPYSAEEELWTETGEERDYRLLSEDERYLLSLYQRLSERDRAKAEGFMEGLLSTQKNVYRSPMSSFSQGEDEQCAAIDSPGA